MQDGTHCVQEIFLGRMITMSNKTQRMEDRSRIDWLITLVPFILIIGVAIFLFVFPNYANEVISVIRFFLGDTLGGYYVIIGIGALIVSFYMAFSKYGNIVLGEQNEKPKYNFFTWGSMMFTCGLAADILFYSLVEWVMYATNPYVAGMGNNSTEWVGVFPLFHWSFIPWAFYLVLAVAFGFMLHCRKRDKQRFSEACLPVIGERNAHGIIGRIIDLFSLFALLAGTATTFSVATPLMAEIILTLFDISMSRNAVTIIILILTCTVYTYAVLHGFNGISLLAKLCIYLFFGLQLAFLFFGGQCRFIIENGVQSLGRMLQNFISLSTYLDPARANNFPQDWTIYYWAYWMVWCIAAPFFIGKISQGRTIKQTILGGYIFGVGSTISSFIILGNYGLGLQILGTQDFVALYNTNGDLYEVIMNIVTTMPENIIFLIWILICMIAFYATSFDSIAYTAACYSYKSLGENEKPHMIITLLWCVLLIILPSALVFSESSMNNVQSVSIISAFPIGIIMILMIWSFFKDAENYNQETRIDNEKKLRT